MKLRLRTVARLYLFLPKIKRSYVYRSVVEPFHGKDGVSGLVKTILKPLLYTESVGALSAIRSKTYANN